MEMRITGWAASAAMVAAQLVPMPAMLAPIGSAPAAAQRYTQISCYSRGNGPNQCRLPRGAQSVTFRGPDRSARCREGETFQQRGDMLWVTGGCGGTFEVAIYDNQGGGWGGSGGGGWGGSGGGWGGSGQDFAGEVTCRSLNNRPQECRVPTRNRVALLQQISGTQCIEGRNWRYDSNSITVRDGCQARFGYGYGNQGGGSGGGWGGNQGFAGNIDCRSVNNRYQRCTASTQNRVELVNQFSQTQCVRGRNWGYDNRSIWVDNGCQARFAYGYGSQSGDYGGGQQSGGGSNAGAIIGGAAIAAGLIALLSQAGKGNRSSSSAQATPATLDADVGRFPADARNEAQACLNEAARQVGATGGTRLRLDQVDTAQRSGNGWMLIARMTGTWPDHSQGMTMDCRASAGTVTAFEIR